MKKQIQEHQLASSVLLGTDGTSLPRPMPMAHPSIAEPRRRSSGTTNTWLRALWTLVVLEARLYIRDPYTAFFALLLPTVLILIFGTIYGNEPKARYGGYGTVDVSVPAYTAMILATIGLVSLPVHLASLRERGILRRLSITPVSWLQLLLAELLTTLVLTLLGMTVLFIVARLVYGLRFGGDAVSVALAFLLSAAALFSLGFALGMLLPTSASAQIVGMVLLYPMIFLTGAAMPRELLPERVHEIARFLPLDPAVRLLRATWAGDGVSAHSGEVIPLLGLVVISALIAALRSRHA